MIRRPDSERGSALTMTLFMIFVLIGVSSSVLSTSLHRYAAVRQEFEQERSVQMAEIGLDAAFYEIQNGVDLEGEGIGVTKGGSNDGSFSVTITPAFAGPGVYTLRSVGTFNRAPVALELVVATRRGVDFGVFALRDLIVTGSFMVDSFSSAVGSYGSQVAGSHADDQGHIASNGDIRVTGSAVVYGNASPGPGQSFQGDSSGVSGATSPSTDILSFPTEAYNPPIASSGNLSGSLALGSGTYRYSTISLQSSDVVSLSGDVTLYVDGAFSVSGSAGIDIAPGSNVTIIHDGANIELSGKGIVNGSLDATMLTIMSSSADNIQISGSAALYAMVYAPDAVVNLSGNADLYGAVIGGLVDLSGTAAVHFDEMVQLPTFVDMGYEVRVARRLANP